MVALTGCNERQHWCKTASSIGARGGSAGSLILNVMQSCQSFQVRISPDKCVQELTRVDCLPIKVCCMTYLTITLHGRQSAKTGDPPPGRVISRTLANASQTAGATSSISPFIRLESTIHPSSSASSSISTWADCLSHMKATASKSHGHRALDLGRWKANANGVREDATM